MVVRAIFSGGVVPGPVLATLLAQAETEGSRLDDAKTLVDMVGTLVTALAVIVAAAWAYYRFVRGRTYRPRLELSMGGQWLTQDGSRYLLARVTVGNIGASKVELIQRGTGLRVSALASSSDPGSVRWGSGTVYTVLEDHAWIEPGETVSDDVLLRLEVPDGQPVMFETRLVCKTLVLRRWGHNTTVHARRVVPSDSTLDSMDQ